MKAFCPNIYCVFVFLTPIMDTLQGESRVQKPWTKEVKMFKIKSNLTWVGEKWQSLFVFWVKKGPQKMFWKRKSTFECASSYILSMYLFYYFCSLTIVFVATSSKNWFTFNINLVKWSHAINSWTCVNISQFNFYEKRN